MTRIRIGEALTAVADSLDPPPPLQPGSLRPGPVPPDAAANEGSAVRPARSGRLPLLVWGIVVTAAVLFAATVVAIVSH